MSWNNVEQKCKLIYQAHFINGKDPVERKMIIKIIADEFPDYSRLRIAFAVDRCITNATEPMSPNTFLTFVQVYLN